MAFLNRRNGLAALCYNRLGFWRNSCFFSPPVHLRRFVGIFFAILLSTTPPIRAQNQADEYRVKAAFLFHFAQLVDWPPEVMGANELPLVFCIVGEDPFAGSLESTVQGKQVAGRSIVVRHIKESDNLSTCHLLFISFHEKKHVAEILSRLKTPPVLTVGETDDFVRQGGMIGFCLQENRIRFDINLLAARRSSLKISSRLLALARSVIGDFPTIG